MEKNKKGIIVMILNIVIMICNYILSIVSTPTKDVAIEAIHGFIG